MVPDRGDQTLEVRGICRKGGCDGPIVRIEAQFIKDLPIVQASRDGGPSGDLYCDIYVREHEFFARHENDIVCEIPLSFAQAAMGADIEVPTLQGKSLLKIPKGTASGALLRMRGLGVTGVNGRGRGDQIVRVVVSVPTKLTKRQEELLAEFSKIEQ